MRRGVGGLPIFGSKKRTRGDVTAATTWSNHKKQCTTTRNKGFVSRMSYHRVPLNYPEKNKREWIPRSTLKRLLNPTSQKKVLRTKDKYRRSPWVSKGSLSIEAFDSKISYANVRWTYWDFTLSTLRCEHYINHRRKLKEINNVHNPHAVHD